MLPSCAKKILNSIFHSGRRVVLMHLAVETFTDVGAETDCKFSEKNVSHVLGKKERTTETRTYSKWILSCTTVCARTSARTSQFLLFVTVAFSCPLSTKQTEPLRPFSLFGSKQHRKKAPYEHRRIYGCRVQQQLLTFYSAHQSIKCFFMLRKASFKVKKYLVEKISKSGCSAVFYCGAEICRNAAFQILFQWLKLWMNLLHFIKCCHGPYTSFRKRKSNISNSIQIYVSVYHKII